MINKVAVLAGVALAPFFLASVPIVQALLILFFPMLFVYGLVSGLSWCGLFTYIYKITDNPDRKKLLWLLPLAVFAFVLPALVICWNMGLEPQTPRF